MDNKPVILVTRKLPVAVEQRLQRDYRALLNPDDRLYSSEELLDLCAGVDAILPCHTEKFSAGFIEKLPGNIRAIANFSVGTDHVDLDAARKKGIIVTNTPDVLSDATAEIAILLMLGAARRGGEGTRVVREQKWRDWSPAFMVGVQITGKRLGIIGMGRVGQVTAVRARGFNMQVHYHNRSRLPGRADVDYTYHETLESLLAHSDVLSIHCPVTPQTTGLLNAERIAHLPDGAIVVNTARGAIVDDDALIDALKTGKLWAAGLDVFNGEPDAIHPQYRELDNVFLLPHIGSATFETRDAMGFRALDNLDCIFSAREPRDRLV